VIGTRTLEALRTSRRAGALLAGAAGSAIVLLVLLNAARDTVSAFIYFNF
jgi:hypothetical protein